MTGVDPYGGHQLVIEADHTLVRLEVGFGHDSGTVYLTPGQARFAAGVLQAEAEKAERDPGVAK